MFLIIGFGRNTPDVIMGGNRRMTQSEENNLRKKGRTKNGSLFLVFSVPFLIQLLAIVGLIGYLSYKNGQETIRDLANRLMTEIGMRIEQDLVGYLQSLEQITRSNAYLVQKGRLDPTNPAALQERFLEQLQNAYLANSAALATEQGDFFALERDNISLIWREHDKKTGVFSSFRIDAEGRKAELTGAIENFDPHNDPPHDPWYRAAKTQKKAVWILAISLAKGMDTPELHMVNFLPFYDELNNIIGVAAASIYLSHFSQFLTRLKVGDTGQSFLIDKQGRLVATSSGEVPFQQQGDPTYAESVVIDKRRITALDSRNPLTIASARAVLDRFTSFDRIDRSAQFAFDWLGKHYFLQIVPIKKNNLDWLTVIVVPETDFMGHIHRNTRFNIILAVLALLLAIGICILTTRWITKPILRLNAVAKQIAKGEWDQPISINRSDEIGELADTFRNMAEKLKSSFDRLQQEVVERKQMAETLRLSEERFRRLLQNIPAIAVQGYRLNGITTYWNEASERFYGYAAREAIGKSLLALIIPTEMKEEVEASMREMARTGQPVPSAELNLLRKDGSRIAVFSNHALVQLPGRPAELFCMDIDLTERKKAEQQLLFSEFSIEHSGVTTIWLDRHGRVVRANQAACHALGYSREELLGMMVHDFDPDFQSGEKWNRTWEKMKELRQYGVIETRHRRKDGSIFPVEVVSSFFDYTGEEYLVSFIHDITSRKQAEAEILREREKLRILSDNAPFGMILINKEGRFTYVNSRFTILLGFSLSDIPDGKTWFRKAYPDVHNRRAAISTWIEDVRNAKPGEQQTRVFSVTCRDGTQKVVQFILSALLSGNFLMTCEDITVMRKLESQLRQAQKMEAIGTLAGGISHDFNNILTAVIGYATLLKMGLDSSGTFQSYVDQILSASQKAADLTQGLLTFSRQQPTSYIPLDINKSIKGTEKLLRRLLTEDIEFRISLTEDDVVVMSDKSQMDQIYFNLIANARDAMPKGGTLTMETRIVSMDTAFIEIHGFGHPGKYVLIKLSDTGMGMDEATREKIFDPFFTTKALGKGTGLGLATVYGIVKQHNGYIFLESEPNRGTVFYIYLPTIEKQIKDEHDESISTASGTETILIAEDNLAVMQVMREALQQAGYTIIEAIDGEVAVETYKKHPHVDLVILDSVMPKKNGWEVYEEIRGINPNLRILFISGYTNDIVLEKGIEGKSFDFITKPLSFDKLFQKIREVLDR